MNPRHILHTLKKQGAGKEVRHLLMDLTNGSGAAVLSQLVHGVETHIATGTEYEMGQKADALARDWVANEEFEYAPDDQPVFDSLKNTIALAAMMGHTFVYDSRYKSSRDLIGEVPLYAVAGHDSKERWWVCVRILRNEDNC